MVVSIRTRRIVLGGALLVTVVASVWPRAQENVAPEVVAPVTQPEVSSRRDQTLPAPTGAPTLVTRVERQQPAAGDRDIFVPKSWEPPPPPVAVRKPTAPPPPMAPPFPYVVTGTILDANGILVVFTNPQQNFVVRVGEVFEQIYRVESVDAQTVTLTYLPLGLTQRVPMAMMN
jgi:hypothetical protein